MALPAAPGRHWWQRSRRCAYRRAVHAARALRPGHPGPGPRTDRHRGVPGRAGPRRAARAAADGRVPLAGPGRAGALAEPALRLRLGRLRRRAGRDHRQQRSRPSWIATATADPASADTLGATVIAPIVEESAKAAAVLLIFLFRRRDFTGIVDGVVIAGRHRDRLRLHREHPLSGQRLRRGPAQIGTSGFASVTAATFFVRVVMTPFAHPLFTVLTGIGFGFAALWPHAASASAGSCCPCSGCCSRWACTPCGTARRRSARTASSRVRGVHGPGRSGW